MFGGHGWADASLFIEIRFGLLLSDQQQAF